MEQIKVSLPPDLLEQLRAEAKREDSSVARIIRRAVRELLSKPFQEAQR